MKIFLNFKFLNYKLYLTFCLRLNPYLKREKKKKKMISILRNFRMQKVVSNSFRLLIGFRCISKIDFTPDPNALYQIRNCNEIRKRKNIGNFNCFRFLQQTYLYIMRVSQNVNWLRNKLLMQIHFKA